MLALFPRPPASGLLVGGLVIGAAIAGLAGGCSGDDAGGATTGFDGGLATSASGTGGGTGGAPGETARDLFAAIEGDLVDACGACHQSQGSADAPFLAQPDRYASITSWPGIISPQPSQSILVTHPADPSHGGGQAPSIPDELAPKVLAWLEKEASDLPTAEDDAGVFIPPFKPFVAGAFNTIYLDPLGDAFKNMSISFNAEELGGTPDQPSMLEITNLTVHPVGTTQLHVVHPLFTVYPLEAPADPDPVDSFSNVDQVFSLQSDLELGTGTVVLTNWTKDAYLGLAFELIEVYGAGGDAGLSDCKDVASFKANAVPKMQVCANCHGSGSSNPCPNFTPSAEVKALASATMDLTKLGDADPAEACIQVRARIAPGDPAQSQILQVPNPTLQAVHMFKFCGNLNDYNDYKNGVVPWIEAEQ